MKEIAVMSLRSLTGTIHNQPAQFVAAFGSDDPGRLDIAPALFQDLPRNMQVAVDLIPVL
jgi:hypothetical protein